MKNTVFYLVMHGQSIGNALRTYLGHTNLDLSELGYEQAKITAEHLRNVPFDAIYSSDLLRAYHTALPTARRPVPHPPDAPKYRYRSWCASTAQDTAGEAPHPLTG